MKSRYCLGLLSGLLFLQACGGGEPRSKEKPLASVYEKNLYPSDLEGIGAGMPKEDSVQQVQLSIEAWVNNQLMLKVAKENIEETAKIERLVEEYRASLILDQYERALIQQRLPERIETEAIADYYAKNKEQYQAGVSWLRCLFVKVDKNKEGLKALSKAFESESGVDFEQVKVFCSQSTNQTKHILNEDIWIRYDELLEELPRDLLTRRHLSGAKILDTEDGQYRYLLQVFEYRDKDQATPLAQVQEEIERIILHQRTNKIINDVRKEVYEKGKKEGSFMVY